MPYQAKPDIFDMIRKLTIPQNAFRVKKIVDYLEIIFEATYHHATKQDQRIKELENQLSQLQSRLDEDEKRLSKFLTK